MQLPLASSAAILIHVITKEQKGHIGNLEIGQGHQASCERAQQLYRGDQRAVLKTSLKQ